MRDADDNRAERPARRTHRGVCVLLHAAGSSPRALGGLERAFQTAGYKTDAPALPMRVEPADCARDAPLAAYIRAAGAALDQLATPAATVARGTHGAPRILFGHSFGGLVALLAALDGKPADALILYEPIVLSALDEQNPDDRAARAWDRALVDDLARGVDAGSPETGIRGFIEAYNEDSWPALPERARQAIISGAAAIRDLTQVVHHLRLDPARLRALPLPVLILRGARSPDITRRMAARLAAQLPGARLELVPDAGHMAPALAADRVAEAALGFLAALTHTANDG